MTDNNPVDHKSYWSHRDTISKYFELLEDVVSAAMEDVNNTEWGVEIVSELDKAEDALNEFVVNIIFQVPL